MAQKTNNFLFGAGASYGSVDCHPSVPPLGKDLFAELEKLGGVAASLSDARREAFRSRFETAMSELYLNDSRLATALQREMSTYFSWFEPKANNLYIKLFRYLIDEQRKFHIATTNYDLLIEHALNVNGRNFIYKRPMMSKQFKF